MRGRLAAFVVGAVLLASPAGALAAGTTPSSTPITPFSPTAPQSQATTPTATAPATVTNLGTSTSGGGVSGGAALGIAIGALVLLTGIGYYIWRDSRRRAPERGTALGSGVGPNKPGSKRPPKPRKLSPAERRRRKRGRAR